MAKREHSYCATRFPNSRLLIMIICLFPFLAGVVGLWCIDQSQPYGRLVCLWISFTYTATWTLSMTVATANTAGHTKKITTNALLLIGYCLGNFVGPFFFTDEQAPVYSLGVGMMFFCTGLQLFCLSGLWVLLWTRNKKRRAMRAGDLRPQEEIIQEVHRAGLADETDFENLYFEVSNELYTFMTHLLISSTVCLLSGKVVSCGSTVFPSGPTWRRVSCGNLA